MAFSMAMPWHQDEILMHRLMRVPEQDNPTSTMLTPQASFMLQRGPLLAIGTLDAHSCPWTTVWGGSAGFSEPLGGGMIGTRTLVDGENDPVVQALVGGVASGEMMHPNDGGKLLSGLAIDLMTRKRVKLGGRMVAGTVAQVRVEVEGKAEQKQAQIQLVTKITQSLGNCPKYLNQYEIVPALVTSEVKSRGPTLSEQARALISESDMFFMSSSTSGDMDTNHRGGPPGFVRIISPEEIIYPEYSGNRLYQSLGNLQSNPKIGITFPNFETGDVLYITGTTVILSGTDAATALPGSNLAVKIKIDEARFVAGGLPFRGIRRSRSPYNPLVRTLAVEGNIKASLSDPKPTQQIAQLIKKDLVTSSIARFTFSVPDGIAYEPGQWIALDFKQELDIGYEHMRDDDPTSLNDDFVRTFTISSRPKGNSSKETTFEILIRRVGPVTKYLFQQNDRAGLEVPIIGVGGDFKIEQEDEVGMTPFIAGGVGITPLLGQLHKLDQSPKRLKLFWTVRLEDVDLVVDVMEHNSGLVGCTQVFFTGDETLTDHDPNIAKLVRLGVIFNNRRMTGKDFEQTEAAKWYLCAGASLRERILAWLTGKTVVFENFDY